MLPSSLQHIKQRTGGGDITNKEVQFMKTHKRPDGEELLGSDSDVTQNRCSRCTGWQTLSTGEGMDLSHKNKKAHCVV